MLDSTREKIRQKYTQAEIGRYMGVAQQTVWQWFSFGVPPKQVIPLCQLMKWEVMDPHARKAWYQSERERLKFQHETVQLVPVSDVRRSFSVVVKAIVQVLETWPDRLERDRGWTASQLNEVQIVVDEIRDTLEKAVIDCCDEADM